MKLNLMSILCVGESLCKYITDKIYNLMRKAASYLKFPWIHTHPAQRLVCKQNRWAPWVQPTTCRDQATTRMGKQLPPFCATQVGKLPPCGHMQPTKGRSIECLALVARGDYISGPHRTAPKQDHSLRTGGDRCFT